MEIVGSPSLAMLNELPEVLQKRLQITYSRKELSAFSMKHMKIAIGVHAGLIDIEDKKFDKIKQDVFCDFIESLDTQDSIPVKILSELFKTLKKQLLQSSIQIGPKKRIICFLSALITEELDRLKILAPTPLFLESLSLSVLIKMPEEDVRDKTVTFCEMLLFN